MGRGRHNLAHNSWEATEDSEKSDMIHLAFGKDQSDYCTENEDSLQWPREEALGEAKGDNVQLQGLNQRTVVMEAGGNSGGGKKWLHSGYILKVETSRIC